MTAADTVKMNRQNAIAMEANKQFGIYEELIDVNKKFIKQLKESSKNTKNGTPKGTVDTLKLICGNIISQTSILMQILENVKQISSGSKNESAASANGQQKEMGEAIKKNNQIKGTVNGELKIAPQSIKELTTSTATTTTKAMEASNKKQAMALKTQKLAQSYATTYKKGGKAAVAVKAGGDITKSLFKVLPKLLLGLKRIIATVMNPAALVALFIAKFFPYVILAIAFLYGVWLGIKDRIGEILAQLPGLIWDGLVLAGELIWEGIKLFWESVWWCVDKISDLIAEGLFWIYEHFGEWWEQLKAVVSFGIDWIKGFFAGIGDWFMNLGYQIKEIVMFCVDWIAKKIEAIKDKIVGIFTSIKDKFIGFFSGIKNTLANSWLGKKLGFGNDHDITNNNVTNTSNTSVTNNSDTEDVIKGMTKKITSPLNQMSKLVENQDKLLKNLNMTPLNTNANFSSGMTPVNSEIIVTPNDNITSTLIQQNSTISTMQANNNKEIATAFNKGIDKLVNTMNANYQENRMAGQQPVTIEG